MFVFAQLGRYTDSLEFSSKTYQGLGLYDEGVIPSSNCIGTECKCQGPTGVCECSSIHPVSPFHPLSPLFTHWHLQVFFHSPTVPFSPTGVCECSSIHPLSPLFTHWCLSVLPFTRCLPSFCTGQQAFCASVIKARVDFVSAVKFGQVCKRITV